MSQRPSSTVKDAMDPARLTAMAATLDRADPDGIVPRFWHHAYFWDARPAADLGRDGHPRTGTGLVPDLGLPRRMWAGGRLEWSAPLQAAREAMKTSRLEAVRRTRGRTGELGLVTLLHDVVQDGRLCLRERQDLVYREEPDPNAPVPDPERTGAAPVEEVRSFDAVTLFRYSALTFNGHRIHYDEPYAREVEGHPGLVVHGPLLAEALIDLATRHLGPLASFDYRATSAATAGEELTFCLDGPRAFVRGEDGRLCMEGRAEHVR